MSISSKAMTFEERLTRLKELIQQFKEGETFYTSKDFVESEVRSKFIDPFLECLKWDVKNEKGARHDKREVITEDRVIVDGQTKHPDYTLMFGGVRKIYIEAKQPSVNLKLDPAPALQVRRYAYTAKMPIAILTDFQELAIYDTRIKPTEKDTAATARIEYLTYNQYEEKFEELYNHISWDAVDLGKFDTYYEGLKEKRGTASVDEDILSVIERWRVLLAEDIALHNEEMNEASLTSCVQKLIDRILFLRITEDKEIEPIKQLQRIVTKNKVTGIPEIENNTVYDDLKTLFKTAETRFNAGLFTNDETLNSLKVQDKTLCTIINELYYPICQYEFSVLPVEILGNIYERFLGKVIRFKRKTKNGHSVEIIEKPEVQKAGGVYYTPSYIVDYIVRETIGKKIEGATPEKVSKLKVCDPACGSGSFLVGAYQYLLDWHLDYYYKEERRASSEKKGLIYKDDKTREYKLSIEEKRRILLNNIFGVDIDVQAVEVTKLSLFLKLLENEGKALSATGQASLFKTSDITKILPSLTQNIKCGNSLIGKDYYADKNLSLLGIEEQKRMNAFEWSHEFKSIFEAGGFDCIIGNPPYVNINTKQEYHRYFKEHYEEIHTGYNDLMYYFIHKGISLLSKDGYFGMITSNYFIDNEYAKKLRCFLNSKVETIINFHNAYIFSKANVHTTLLFASKHSKKQNVHFYDYLSNETPKNIELNKDYKLCTIKRLSLSDSWLISDKKDNLILEKLKNNTMLLGDIAIIEKGSSSGKNVIFTVPTAFAIEKKFEKDVIRKNVKNADIKRYHINDRKNVLIYIDKNTNIKQYPNIYNYLLEHKKELSSRNEVLKGMYQWYRLERPRDKAIFDAKEKLIVPYRAEHNRFAYDDEQYFNDGGDVRAIVIKEGSPYSIKYVLALLNSKLLDWYYGFIGKVKGRSREYFNTPLAQLPIYITSLEEQQELIKLVEQMLEAHKELEKAKFEQDKKFLKQRVDILDAQINAIVYSLYGLTEEEIKIVEG